MIMPSQPALSTSATVEISPREETIKMRSTQLLLWRSNIKHVRHSVISCYLSEEISCLATMFRLDVAGVILCAVIFRTTHKNTDAGPSKTCYAENIFNKQREDSGIIIGASGYVVNCGTITVSSS
ncbi:hypothetical protein QBC36DRAFT_314282 [Triangularia setosa]|uniref:Uncharacterized protein n=1 Tax=Triangularia setosa TaxID=2587417 RepID=A0AAN7A5C3_9PEZI|nr:hypothetical protein QBC36DRAFT_314282 [Podospora setosa]